MKKVFLIMVTILAVNAKAAENMPDIIQINSGELKIELAKRVFWNLNGVWLNGRMVCQKNQGFCGTVISFKGLGWVGTGHLENKIGETELKFEFEVDGKPCRPKTVINCHSFKMKKSALLHQIRLVYVLQVKNNRIYESAVLKVEKDSEVGTIYHFMHPWEPIFAEYLLRDIENKDNHGVFSEKNLRKFVDGFKPCWASFYSQENKLGFVSLVKDTSKVPNTDKWLIWNRGRDRKLYYVAMQNASLKAGQEFSAEMTTAFYTASPEQWKNTAAELVSGF